MYRTHLSNEGRQHKNGIRLHRLEGETEIGFSPKHSGRHLQIPLAEEPDVTVNLNKKIVKDDPTSKGVSKIPHPSPTPPLNGGPPFFNCGVDADLPRVWG